MPFVRTRKGPGNSDFLRAERQQNLLMGAIKYTTAGELDNVASVARGQVSINQVRTNLPTSLGAITDWFNVLDGSYLAHRVVFAPNTYSTRIPGTSSYQLKLSAVRAWTAAYMN